MMVEQLKLHLSGHVAIRLVDKDKNKEIVYNDHNAIQNNAYTILARCIGAINNHIDYIETRASGILMTAAAIPGLGITFPSPNVVRFAAEFDYLEAVGVIDELRLVSSVGGIFSKIDGLTITKPNTVKMQVIWTLTISDCAGTLPDGIFDDTFDGTFE